jgi:transcription antitermination protein NusB
MTEKIYKNTSSRLASVQILYSLESRVGKEEISNFDEKEIEKIVEKYHQTYLKEKYGIDEGNSNKKFVLRLVTSAIMASQDITTKIQSSLDKVDSLGRMNILMQSVLRCAVAELSDFDTPAKIVIKEYLKISDSFFSDSEVSFVNGVLDKITKNMI